MNLSIAGVLPRVPLTLGAQLGKGGEAVVWDVSALAGCAAKVYTLSPAAVSARRPKLKAMLERPPATMSVVVNGLPLPLLAWPTHLLEHANGALAGYLMRKVDLARAARLSEYMRMGAHASSLSAEDRSLPRRLELCRNLAGIMADLHRQGHYIVDFKPQNIYVFRDTAIPCILDNDGFSIGTRGQLRFGAGMFTPEFASPELNSGGVAVNAVDDDLADRFSLALLIFTLLNNGIHPFQGVTSLDREQNTNEQSIRDGLYAYGLVNHPLIGPKPGSVHGSFPAALRRMFDRAFSATPSQRPTALDWRKYLDELKKTRDAFSRCEQWSQDVLHIHFAGVTCPECARMAQDATVPVVAASEPRVGTEAEPAAAPAEAAAASTPRRSTPSTARSRRMRWLVLAMLFLIALWLGWMAHGGRLPL